MVRGPWFRVYGVADGYAEVTAGMGKNLQQVASLARQMVPRHGGGAGGRGILAPTSADRNVLSSAADIRTNEKKGSFFRNFLKKSTN